jgi:hypothetical protein
MQIAEAGKPEKSQQKRINVPIKYINSGMNGYHLSKIKKNSSPLDQEE